LEEIHLKAPGAWIPLELCPNEADAEDDVRFFVNYTKTVGLAVNETKQRVRVIFAEMGLADTDWISVTEAMEVSAFE